MACLGTSLATIVVGARVFGRARGMHLIRNFVTYDRTEQHLRPQLGIHAGAFRAGVIAGLGCPTIRA